MTLAVESATGAGPPRTGSFVCWPFGRPATDLTATRVDEIPFVVARVVGRNRPKSMTSEASGSVARPRAISSSSAGRTWARSNVRRSLAVYHRAWR